MKQYRSYSSVVKQTANLAILADPTWKATTSVLFIPFEYDTTNQHPSRRNRSLSPQRSYCWLVNSDSCSVDAAMWPLFIRTGPHFLISNQSKDGLLKDFLCSRLAFWTQFSQTLRRSRLAKERWRVSGVASVVCGLFSQMDMRTTTCFGCEPFNMAPRVRGCAVTHEQNSSSSRIKQKLYWSNNEATKTNTCLWLPLLLLFMLIIKITAI